MPEPPVEPRGRSGGLPPHPPSPPAPPGATAAGPDPPAPPASVASEIESAAKLIASIAGLAGFVYLIGGVITWIKLAAARVPADAMTALVDPKAMFAVGLKVIVFAALVFAVVLFVAYGLGRTLFWKRHRADWHAVVTRRPSEARKLKNPKMDEVEAPLGDGVVQAVAGLNFAVLGGIAALAVSKVVEELFDWSTGVVAAVTVVGALLVVFLAARRGPFVWLGSWRRYVLLVATFVVTIFAAAPIGVLVLASVAITLLGRVIARTERPTSIAAALRAPLPWALLTVYMLVAAAFVAQPPISFTRAVVSTAAGTQTGGYIARTSDGVYLVTCRGLADASSRDERSVLIPADTVKSTTFGGEAFRVDPGQRPSLATLLLGAIGVKFHVPTWFRADLRTSGATCGGAARAEGTLAPALGDDVVVGPAPPEGHASGGERTIEQTTPALAKLARRLQPTVEVTVADRFWPVSVASVLQDRGTFSYGLRNGGRDGTCLVKAGRCVSSPPALAELAPAGASPDDSLDYPATLDTGDPTAEFQAYLRGQGVPATTISNWLAEPAALDPWRSAQVYVYDAGVGGYDTRYKGVPAGLRNLQYWFFYPYNYYPTAVSAKLMPYSPIAAVLANTDLHEGDWEHVAVLLDPKTLHPRYLYMARHDQEGQTYAWTDPALHFDEGHPIVQAALGGHPTYPDTCGRYSRSYVKGVLSDWVVCGSGRFAFRGATTPLVDLARTSWACWPGHFGEASPRQIRNAALPESDPRRYLYKYVLVAGPRSPLRQAENASRACR